MEINKKFSKSNNLIKIDIYSYNTSEFHFFLNT